MTFTDLFVHRPVLAAVISLLLCLLGGMGYSQLAVRETPDVQTPVVTVTTSWPGADPAIVESDLTEVLERELNGIEGVRTLSSSSQEGSSQITVEFDLERDLEAAANDVRSKVSRARRRLPDDVDEPVVEKSDASAQPVMFLRLAAEGRSLLEITEIADTIVRDRLENVEGVSGVDLFGAQTYAMRIELDAARMAARGVTVADIDAALRAGNVELPAGRLEGEATQLTLHLEGGLDSPEAFGALIVRATGPSRVYLRDVASIRLGAENERSAGRADGEPSLSVAITPQAKANVLDVSNEVLRRIPGIQADLPPGMTLDNVYDRADSVRHSIRDVQLTLGVAFALVVGVIFLFLRDARSTLIPSIAIPVSLVGTFLVLWIAGFTVNVFTLFGLVLAIGLVVDDAIVVLENIVRRIEEGESVHDATLLGTRQIAMAVIATTLSLVAVFLPVIFTGGTSGRLFLEFGTTVAASVAISMIVALTLTPMLCSRLLRAVPPGTRPPHGPEGDTGLVARLFARSLRGVVRRPWLVVPVLLLSLGGVGWGFTTLPREFFPTEDRNMILVRTQATEGTSFAWMNARMHELEPELMRLVPERRTLLSRVAMAPGGVTAGTNTGMYLLPLVTRDQRDRSQQEIVAALRGPLAEVTAFRTVPIQFPTVGRAFSPPLQVVLQHPDFDALTAQLPAFVAAMRKIPGLSSVNEDLRLDRPELWVHPDRERAAELGVALRDVARTLQVATSGLDLSTFERGVRQYKVIVSLPPAERASPDDLAGLYLRAKDGRMVPLSGMISTRERAGAASRFHYNRAPSATVSANVDGITLGEGIDRALAMAAQELPEGFRVALAGESKDFQESSSSLTQMFLLALALVYLLLAAQFDSFVAPISIMLAVPLALVGAFVSLGAFGFTLSFFGQVGLILLVGLVTKNGILIVEYARQLEHTEGVGPWEAAERAARLRLRPILMTSVATIGGALPIAFGLSGESRSSLGVAVAGGMVSATILTLYVTPIVYAALAGLRRKRAAVAVVAAMLAVTAGEAKAGEAETAAGTMTLAAALSIAADANLGVLQAEAGLRGVEAGARAARAGVLPIVAGSAGLAAGNDPRFVRTSDGGFGTYGTAGVRVDVPVLDLGALGDVRAARAGVDAATAGVDATVEGVLAGVAARFVALQRAEASVTAAAARVAEAERLTDQARHRVEVGAAPSIDGTRAALALSTANARLLAARTAAVDARVRLAEALGMPVDAAVRVVAPAPLVDPAKVPTDAALSEALETARGGPAMTAARAALDAATAGRKAAAASSVPTLDVYGQVGATSDLAGTTAAPLAVVGASVTVPIFAGGALAASRDAAAADEAQQRIGVDALERAVEAELRVALRTWTDAATGLAVAEGGLALAQEQLARAEARYAAGADDNLAVVGAQSDLADAEQARVDALAAYNLAVVRWFAAQGRVSQLGG